MEIENPEIQTSGPSNRTSTLARRIVLEAVVGATVGLLLLLAIVASTGEIPFVYQGY